MLDDPAYDSGHDPFEDSWDYDRGSSLDADRYGMLGEDEDRDGKNMVVLQDFRKIAKNKKERNAGVQTLRILKKSQGLCSSMFLSI